MPGSAGGLGGLSGRWVNTRTEADAKLWRRYLQKVTPERREWSSTAHHLWLIAVVALVVIGVILGAIG